MDNNILSKFQNQLTSLDKAIQGILSQPAQEADVAQRAHGKRKRTNNENDPNSLGNAISLANATNAFLPNGDSGHAIRIGKLSSTPLRRDNVLSGGVQKQPLFTELQIAKANHEQNDQMQTILVRSAPSRNQQLDPAMHSLPGQDDGFPAKTVNANLQSLSGQMTAFNEDRSKHCRNRLEQREHRALQAIQSFAETGKSKIQAISATFDEKQQKAVDNAQRDLQAAETKWFKHIHSVITDCASKYNEYQQHLQRLQTLTADLDSFETSLANRFDNELKQSIRTLQKEKASLHETEARVAKVKKILSEIKTSSEMTLDHAKRM